MLKRGPTAYDRQSTCRNDGRFQTILQTSSMFAGLNADDLDIDMPKRTLFVVDSTKQLCFAELNADDLNNDMLKRTLNFVDPAK